MYTKVNTAADRWRPDLKALKRDVMFIVVVGGLFFVEILVFMTHVSAFMIFPLEFSKAKVN